MDFSKLAQDVLAAAGEKELLKADLGETEQGLRDFLAQLGTQVLQLHLNQQERPGYEGSSRACQCGQSQRFVGYRPRTLETLFGPVTARRAYYHCAACGKGFIPYDAQQGLGSRCASVALSKVVVSLSQAMAFREAASHLETILGRRLGANTINRITRDVGSSADAMEQEAAEAVKANRHEVPALEAGRLYMEADGAMVHRLDAWHEVKALICRWQDAKGNWHARHLCRNETVEKFAVLAHACMHVCGLDNARQSVLLGDGIPWIWNHLGPIADRAVEIVDWYHAREHLFAAAKAVHGEGTKGCSELGESLSGLLWESRMEELLKRLEQERGRVRSPAKRGALDELKGYLERHRSRMDYKNYRDQGLDIGSGAIEGVCKNLIHQRMKRGSPRWSDEGCQSMLSLRSCYANAEQTTLWNRKPLLAA